MQILNREVQYGYCHCGCGEKTNTVKWSDKSKNLTKGEPYRFVKGHVSRSLNWKRESRNKDGRLMIYSPKHKRAMSNGYVLNHLLVAELSLGKTIEKRRDVHHVNSDKTDDSPANLVICEGRAYHSLLHQRTRALKSCGNAKYLKCSICGEYDNPENIMISKKTKFHRDCRNERRRNRYKLGLTRY